MTWQERLAYDAVCLQGWTILDAAASRRLLDGTRMRLAFDWMAAFHLEWLHNNAHLFGGRRFWRRVKSVESGESRLLRHRPVPSETGLASWDDLNQRYFQMVFSPFDPMMPKRTALTDSIERALAASSADVIRLVDLGCGPGHLLNVLDGLPTVLRERVHYVGIDRSRPACESTRRRAELLGIPAEVLNIDLLNVAPPVGDVVVAVNTVLGGSRDENVTLLRAVRSSAHDHARVVLLLPAFEVMEHIIELRRSWYESKEGRATARRAVDATLRVKHPDAETASYSDDGVVTQFFHSLETIDRELAQVGLAPLAEPVRLDYPWSLARKFDYGYFPDQPPVWDWLVECRPARLAT